MISIPDIPQKLIQNQSVSLWEVPCLRGRFGVIWRAGAPTRPKSLRSQKAFFRSTTVPLRNAIRACQVLASTGDGSLRLSGAASSGADQDSICKVLLPTKVSRQTSAIDRVGVLPQRIIECTDQEIPIRKTRCPKVDKLVSEQVE